MGGLKTIKIIFFSVIFCILVCSYGIYPLLDSQQILTLTKEDGPVESIGAVFFFLTSTLFFFLFFQDNSGNDFWFFRMKKNVFFLCLGLTFFLGFAEEISWGQRIFNISTPESIKEINLQQELNIHNLYIFHADDEEGKRKSFFALLLNIDRLFSMFWFLYCVAIPILVRYHSWSENKAHRLNLPLVPIWLGIFFPVNYIISKMLEFYAANERIQSTITEVKETNFALLFFLVSTWFFIDSRNKVTQLPNIHPKVDGQ